MANNGLFQTFLQFHDKPYYSQVLHLRDGQLGITLLSCRACAVTEETRDLLPPAPAIMTLMENRYPAISAIFSPAWLYQESHFQPAVIVISFLTACWNSVLELSSRKKLADRVISRQRIPFGKNARCAHVCTCSIHVTLVTGQNMGLGIVFQVHQHSFSLELSLPRAGRLQESAGCLREINQIVSDSLWSLCSSGKCCYTP